jgi:hypothetical protein
MAIGDFWNIDTPDKPWGPFDPDARVMIPIGVTDWLAEMGTTYADHEVIAASPLEHLNGKVHSSGTIWVFIGRLSGAEYTPGVKYPFTVRLIGADTQRDDRTFWLKMAER